MGLFKSLFRRRDDGLTQPRSYDETGSPPNSYYATDCPSYPYYATRSPPPTSLLAVGAPKAKHSSEPLVQELKGLAPSGYTNEPRMRSYDPSPLSGYRREPQIQVPIGHHMYTGVSNTGSETSNFECDHNARHRLRPAEAPAWYISRPIVYEKGHPSYLCPTCRHINLKYLFYDSDPAKSALPENYIALGSLKDITQKTECGLCRIVAGIARLAPSLGWFFMSDQRQSAVDRLNQRLAMECHWYLSPFRYSHEQIGTGFQLYLRRNVFETGEMPEGDHRVLGYPLGIRLITNEARGGRAVPPDHMDFGWVKRTLELCDLSTDMPSPNFEQPLRCIDTKSFCVAELPHNARYVALSYPWGKATQFQLTRQTDYIRQVGGLFRVFNQLPATIQDAIQLVLKVGQRYLWVDSLCILQDDEKDVRRQMDQMGEIYRNSYFTIFAVSGTGADYGLPLVRPGTRKHKQLFEKVQGMWITNMFPSEDQYEGSWKDRGWTFQERLRSQRSLFVSDNGVSINCMHVNSPEEEHCWHTLKRNEKMISRGHMYFFEGQNSGCTPYIMDKTPFDMYTLMVSEYSRRHLTYQEDAPLAFLGVIDTLQHKFGTNFIHSLPEGEIDAALLWSPIGSSIRRCHPETGGFLFPSWSWIGWNGHAAYPWALERDSFISTVDSPLEWKNVSGFQSGWFTSDDLCFPSSDRRKALLTMIKKDTQDHLGARKEAILIRQAPKYADNPLIQWPNRRPPLLKYIASPTSHRLTFCTLTCRLSLCGRPYKRQANFNVTYPVWRMSVCDSMETMVGYIDVPDPSTRKIPLLEYEFAVLSRSTVNGEYEPGPEALENKRLREMWSIQGDLCQETAQRTPERYRVEKGNFDRRSYDDLRPWCMFNVLMLEWVGEVAYRVAVGRVHVDAVLGNFCEPEEKVIYLE